jgi:hypothetical protein
MFENCLAAVQGRSRCPLMAAAMGLLSCLGMLSHTAVFAADPLVPSRRVYVPLEDLDVVVDREARGVLLPRAEFEKLAEQARRNAAVHPPLPGGTAVPVCDYTARIVGDHLLIHAVAELRQFHADWQSWSFPLQRLAVERAACDPAPSLLGRGANGELRVLTPEAGKHRLELDLSTELVALGSDQAAAFSLLGSSAGEFRITLPAGKRLLVDGLLWERPAAIDQPAEYRLPIGGRANLQLRITDRTTERAADTLLFATTGYGVHVTPGEVTWHALTTLQVFGRTLDKVILSVPSKLEIVDVEATGLEGWELSDDPQQPQRTQIALTFGQPFEGQRKITLRGVMPVLGEEAWSVPALLVSQATSHISQVVVQHPAGVRLQIVEMEGVRRATRQQQPVSDMPDDMDRLAAVHALRFDAWREAFTLRLVTQPKQRELHAAVAAVLDAAAAGVELQAALTVTAKFAPLFDVEFTVPAEWTFLAATTAEGHALAWELLPGMAGTNRVRVKLAAPVPSDGSTIVKLQLRREVEGWPVESEPVEFQLPEIGLPQAALTETALVVRGDNDLELTVEDVRGLDAVPLQAAFERLRFQAQDTRYSGRLKVTRKPARIAAEHVSFHRLDPPTLFSALYVRVTVLGGGARELVVSLPDSEGLQSLGSAVRFHATGAVLVEQQPLPVENGRGRWRLKFADRVRGAIVLFTQLELPRTAEASVQAPLLAVADAERESGVLVVEAGAEQRLTISAVDELGQPLTELDPLDVPAVPYVPQERIVAVYRTVSPKSSLTLTEERFGKAAVPTAVCSSLAMTTMVARTGEVQQQVVCPLMLSGVQQVGIELPEGARLWAALLDGQPVEVRRADRQFLIPVQGAGTGTVDTRLELYYREQQQALSGSGTWKQKAPFLTVVSGQGTQAAVEVLQQEWTLIHPDDTLVIEASGPLEPQDAFDTPGWLAQARNWLRRPRGSDAAIVALTVAVVSGGLALLLMLYRRFRSLGVWVTLGLLAVGCLLALPWLLLPGGKHVAVATGLRRSPHVFEHDRKIALPGPASALSGMAQTVTPSNGAFDQLGEALSMEQAPASRITPLPTAAAEQPMPPQSPAAPGISGEFEERQRQAPLGDELSRLAKAQAAAAPAELANRAGEIAAGQERGTTREERGKQRAENEQIPAVGAEAPLADDRPAANGRAMNGPAAPPAAKTSSGVAAASGLLSLVIQLERPSRSREKRFKYVGAGQDGATPLEIQYLDRRRSDAVRCFGLVLGLVLGWFARGQSCLRKLLSAACGLAVTWGGLPLIPVAWHVLWDGLFAGVVGAVVVWCLHGCCRWCTGALKCCQWVVCLVVLTSGMSLAQEKEKPLPPQRIPPAVIVPYDAAQAPLAAERVWLPYDKFVELYRLAHPEKPVRSPAPEAGGIVEALYAARLQTPEPGAEQGVVDITARLMVRSYVEGQWLVALPFRGVALSDARLNGQPAAIRAAESGLRLVVPDAGWHVLDVRFAVPARLTGAAGSFQLTLEGTPAARLTFALPQPKDAVRVNGSTTAFRRVTKDDGAFIEVPVDRGGELQVNWQPEQTQGGGSAVIHVEGVHAVALSDLGVTVSSGFRYRVRQGVMRDVSLHLPEAVRLQAVSGPDVGGWELLGDGAERKLRIFLRRNVGDSTQFTVDGYVDHRVNGEGAALLVPGVMPLDVTAETGHVVVYSGEQFALRAEQTQQLTQMNVENFQPIVPVTRPATAPQLLYRFSRRPWSLTLRASRSAAQVTATVQQGVWIAHRKVQTTNRVLCDLARVPLSTLDLDVPADWLILDIQAAGLKDWYLTKGETRSTATIEFTQPREGQIEIVVLATAARNPQTTGLTLSSLTVRGAQKHQRTAAVWLDAGVNGVVASLGDWKSIDAGSIPPELQRLRPSPAQFAFQTSANDPGPIELSLTSAVPRLTANSLTTISVTDVATIYGFVWQWQIDAAATDTLAVETSDWLAGRMDFSGDHLREVTSAPAGAGRVRWTVALRGPVTGKFVVAAAATLPPATDRVAAPTVAFFPAGDRDPLETQQHYVLLINTSLSQLTSHDASLSEPVQREDVPIIVRQELVDQAAEFVRVKSASTPPSWTMRRFVSAAAVPASVNLADLVTVLSRDGTYRTAATFTIKNRGRQFLAVQLPEGGQLLAVTVQSKPSRAVSTRLDDRETHLIALPKTSAADLSFPVQVVYAGRLPHPLPSRRQLASQKFDLPAPRVVEQSEAFGIPVARTRWTVYLPDDLEAAPLSDPKRHNLNQRRAVATDDTVVRVLLQDFEDLLQALDVSSSGKTRSLAEQNLRQLNQAIGGYVQQLQSDRQLAAETERLQQRLESKLSELAERERGDLPDQRKRDEAAGRPVVVQSGDAQQQLDIALKGYSAIISDNLALGVQVERSVESTFNFALQQPASESAAAGTAPSQAAAEAAQQATQLLGNNLDARRQYQARNSAILEELNRDVSEKKARFAAPEPPGRASGLVTDPTSGRDASKLDGQQKYLSDAKADGALVREQEQRQLFFHEFDVDRGMALEGLMGGIAGGGIGGGGIGDGGMGGVGGVPAIAQLDGQQLEQGQQGVRRGAVAALSLPIQLPQTGQVLVFSKAGGDPKLALAVRPRQAVQWLLAWGWSLAWFAAVVALWRAVRSPHGVRWVSRALPLVLAAAGIAGMLWLSTPLNLLATAVFVVSAAVIAWQHRHAATTANN